MRTRSAAAVAVMPAAALNFPQSKTSDTTWTRRMTVSPAIGSMTKRMKRNERVSSEANRSMSPSARSCESSGRATTPIGTPITPNGIWKRVKANVNAVSVPGGWPDRSAERRQGFRERGRNGSGGGEDGAEEQDRGEPRSLGALRRGKAVCDRGHDPRCGDRDDARENEEHGHHQRGDGRRDPPRAFVL